MPFKKGIKTEGQGKRGKAKVTTEVKEMFKSLIHKNLDKLQDDIDALEPKDRVNTMLKLATFIIPTMKAQDVKLEAKSNIPEWLMNLDEQDLKSAVEKDLSKRN